MADTRERRMAWHWRIPKYSVQETKQRAAIDAAIAAAALTTPHQFPHRHGHWIMPSAESLATHGPALTHPTGMKDLSFLLRRAHLSVDLSAHS